MPRARAPSLPGWTRNPDGSKTINSGHGIGSNYWDIMPFGWDDFYATSQYYAATLAMAEMEEAIITHPEWNIPLGALAMDSEYLRKHAENVKETANKLFWNEETCRFYAAIDKEGVAREYGYTFLNLDAIWYGIADDEHAATIMDWLTGKRIVEGDTSTGEDIYHWRFGPRATTKRNLDWYFYAWTSPESIPWGGQVQDGGAVLGFSFYDLWARVKLLGPDNAWERLCEILDWEEDVWKEGGYRAYYADGKQGTTLQGGGTAGGLGIDAEFHESSLLPSIVTLAFIGLEPTSDALVIRPRLPKACPEMGIRRLLYQEVPLDILVRDDSVSIRLLEKPSHAIRILLDGEWALADTSEKGSAFSLTKPGSYRWLRSKIAGTE